MIEVDERFEVPASPEAVWGLLADPYAVVGCVPGASIVSQADDGSLETSLTVKFGPLSVGFQAHAILELAPERMVGRISARGKDKQGGARFHANATFTVVESPTGSMVTTSGEVELSGRLASIIESGAGVIVKRMSGEFAECLRARCE